MTDPGPDARDDQVAGWLAVEPLDDLTRRRLVDGALRATSRRRSWRWIAAAASVVAIAVVSALLATAGGGGQPEAARSKSPAASRSGAAQSPTAALAPSSADSAGVVADLGDYGSLDARTGLDALRGAAEKAAGAGGSPRSFASNAAGAPGPSRVAVLEARLAAARCASRRPAGAVVGLGTGRVGGRDALVVAIVPPGGAPSSVVLVAITTNPCSVHSLG